MGWVTPEKIRSKYDAELLGTNEIFDLLKWKRSLLQEVVSKSKIGIYRIILRGPNSSFIVAGWIYQLTVYQ